MAELPTNDPWFGANPDDADFKQKLHERYHVLREHHPVHATPRGTWRLTRYDDCVTLLRHARAGVRTEDGRLPFADESRRPRAFMLDLDPPDHDRVRGLVRHAFTPKALRPLHERIEQTTAELLDGLAGRERFDLVADLAIPLPAAMICAMLGVPFEDRDKFLEWTTNMTYFILGVFASPEQSARAHAAIDALEEYIQGLIDARRAQPTDDLLSVMVAAEEEGERLTNDELIWQSMGLLLAGFETTTGLIANGVRQLLLHRDQWERLCAEPDLIDTAVEECLRFDPPIVGAGRFVWDDLDFDGTTIPAGSWVLAVTIAANRDPARFEDPDRFDIARKPNQHLAFGGGIHHCLGAHLARLEGRAVIGSLAARFPNLQLESDDVTWGRSLFRIPADLWVRP